MSNAGRPGIARAGGFGWSLPWLGRVLLAPRLGTANQVMFEDLARVA